MAIGSWKPISRAVRYDFSVDPKSGEVIKSEPDN